MTGLVDLAGPHAITRTSGPAFGDLESLRSLHLDRQQVGGAGRRQPAGPANLQHLILSGNQLGRIAPGAFDDFLGSWRTWTCPTTICGKCPGRIGRHARPCTPSTWTTTSHCRPAFAPGGTQLSQLSRLDLTSNACAR